MNSASKKVDTCNPPPTNLGEKVGADPTYPTCYHKPITKLLLSTLHAHPQPYMEKLFFITRRFSERKSRSAY